MKYQVSICNLNKLSSLNFSVDLNNKSRYINKMKIKNNWLILKGKFKCKGFCYGDGSVMKSIELRGEEGEVFGSDWKEVKKGVYVSGMRKLVRV